ncbi:Uu.00g081810.m01.CDS01 [Anthostomella pinea]|uniref:25S rRNA adenine-N(1) methyltransferase n=1 Tax=Anthostomella pinea TaxID=933095 RepID=A0AAI8VL88_9PEZI|nr:Uu.00g081810.m01.CDS01 [Anthostomella pinea]
MPAQKNRPNKSLAQGRPPGVQKPKSISRKNTKALINSLHLLEKKKAQAKAKGDKAAEAAADGEIAALGGIEKYQQASLQGQRNDRGGDSSRVLMEWLKPILSTSGLPAAGSLRMLEVGALSTTNICSQSGFFDMERIDLNSQSQGILQQDFMQRQLPTNDAERFDIISLSLVLNFVPDAQVRGNMLLRTLEFLKEPVKDSATALRDFFPSLFFVLPKPCVSNSRYMTEEHLESIMNSLGYTKAQSKMTQRVVYYLWTKSRPLTQTTFKKAELLAGPSRNNFSIVLRGPSDEGHTDT